MKLLLLRVVDEAATKCTPGMGHGPASGGTHACHVYALKHCCGATLNG